MNREVKKPDLNAPRCRYSVHKIITKMARNLPNDHSFLKEFKTLHPQYKLTNNQANSILDVFHGKLWDHALNNRDGVELPEGLGFIFLGTCNSPKKYNVNYEALIKNDIQVRHRNFESDSKLAKIFYTNFATKYKFRNREMWCFTATRDFKRAVPPVYRANWKIYVEVENGRNISNYMKRIAKDNYFKKRSATYVVDSSYNEFDLN